MIRIGAPPGRLWSLRTGVPLLFAVLGVVAVLVGAYLVWLDGNGTCNAPGVTCPREYATQRLGLLIGGAGAVAFVIALVIGMRSLRRG